MLPPPLPKPEVQDKAETLMRRIKKEFYILTNHESLQYPESMVLIDYDGKRRQEDIWFVGDMMTTISDYIGIDYDKDHWSLCVYTRNPNGRLIPVGCKYTNDSGVFHILCDAISRDLRILQGR